MGGCVGRSRMDGQGSARNSTRSKKRGGKKLDIGFPDVEISAASYLGHHVRKAQTSNGFLYIFADLQFVVM